MSVIGLLVLIAIAAVVLWGLGQLPLDPALAGMIRVVVIIVIAVLLILWIASLFGYQTNAIRIR